MILSDRDIQAKIASGAITVDSPQYDVLEQVHASSLDLRLGNFFKVYKRDTAAVLDPRNMAESEKFLEFHEVKDGAAFVVAPGMFVLGVTLETITLPADIVARVEGRSSLGRLGIAVHSTAGFIDAGFQGTITLEISNVNTIPVALYPGMRVCQLAFQLMTSPAAVPYGEKKSAKYQGQSMPEASKVSADPEFQ